MSLQSTQTRNLVKLCACIGIQYAYAEVISVEKTLVTFKLNKNVLQATKLTSAAEVSIEYTHGGTCNNRIEHEIIIRFCKPQEFSKFMSEVPREGASGVIVDFTRMRRDLSEQEQTLLIQEGVVTKTFTKHLHTFQGTRWEWDEKENVLKINSADYFTKPFPELVHDIVQASCRKREPRRRKSGVSRPQKASGARPARGGRGRSTRGSDRRAPAQRRKPSDSGSPKRKPKHTKWVLGYAPLIRNDEGSQSSDEEKAGSIKR